jgi:4-hydroxy-3-polyprenylbenzoate decarboxylase
LAEFVIGITGASGSIYGIRLIQELGQRKHDVNVVITYAGKQVMMEELGISDKKEILRLLMSFPSRITEPAPYLIRGDKLQRESRKRLDSGSLPGMTNKKDVIRIWENDNFEAPFMSGSNAPEAVVIIPCSVGKLAAVANGISGNLLERIADVALKERRRLILVVRETPLSLIHLENMVKAAKAGAEILPAMPAFYHHPKTVDDMVNFIVGKVLNLLRIEHNLFKGWRKG